MSLGVLWDEEVREKGKSQPRMLRRGDAGDRTRPGRGGSWMPTRQVCRGGSGDAW